VKTDQPMIRATSNRGRNYRPHRKNNSQRPDKTRQPETSHPRIVKPYSDKDRKKS